MAIVLVSHDLGFVTSLVQRVICVNRQAVAHPASQLTADVIREMYGGDVNVVRHGDVMCHREHVHLSDDFFDALRSTDAPAIRYALIAGLLVQRRLGDHRHVRHHAAD